MDNTEPLLYFVLSSIVAIALALTMKFLVRPKIESVYAHNRNDLIDRMLNRISQLDRGMANIFEVMMRQPGFISNQQRAYQLSPQDLAIIDLHSPIISTVFDEFNQFATDQHWRLHLNEGEFDSLLQYVHFSNQFVLELSNTLNVYNELPLEARKRFCFEMIQHFRNKLYHRWHPLENSPTLLHVFDLT